MSFQHLTISILFTIAATSTPAAAAPQEDLAFGVQELSNPVRGWVVSKLLTLNLGKKCWAKVTAKNSRAMALLSAYASNIERYATTVTGDNWETLLAGPNGRDKNREIVEKMVDAFKTRFHLTVNVEGDDCTEEGLWIRYVSVTTTALVDYPPKSGKAFVTIHATAKAKGVKTEVSKDGTSFTITGSRDLEQAVWMDDIQKPFKRVSTKN